MLTLIIGAAVAKTVLNVVATALLIVVGGLALLWTAVLLS